MAEIPVIIGPAGRRLSGMLHLPDTAAPAPAVLMLHGFTGNRLDPRGLPVRLARRLAARGVASLRCDFLGSGESDGDFADTTVSGQLADGSRMLEFLRAHPRVAAGRVALHGHSMGGMIAALLAARSPEMAAVSLWAPLGEVDARLRQAHAPLFRQAEAQGIVEFNYWPIKSGFFTDLEAQRPYAALAAYPGPVQIIHGDGDETVPVLHGQRYAEAAGARARLHLLPGASHTFVTQACEARLLALTEDWLCARLAG